MKLMLRQRFRSDVFLNLIQHIRGVYPAASSIRSKLVKNVLNKINTELKCV